MESESTRQSENLTYIVFSKTLCKLRQKTGFASWQYRGTKRMAGINRPDLKAFNRLRNHGKMYIITAHYGGSWFVTILDNELSSKPNLK